MTSDEIFAAVDARQLNQIPGGVTAKELAGAQSGHGWSALHEAAHCSILDQVKGGVTVSQLARARNDEGWTALHVAMKYGSLSHIRGKLTVRALAAVADNEGRTVLHSAVYNRRLDCLHGKIIVEHLFAVRDNNGFSALSEIGSQIALLDGGATFAQLVAAKGRRGYTPIDRLADSGELNLIRGGVAAIELRSVKPDNSDDALMAALWMGCPLEQIRGGVPRGLVSLYELNKVLTSTLQFDGANAFELIQLGADQTVVLEAIRNANANILAENNGKYDRDQKARMRMLLKLAAELKLSLDNLVDPLVTAALL